MNYQELQSDFKQECLYYSTAGIVGYLEFLLFRCFLLLIRGVEKLCGLPRRGFEYNKSVLADKQKEVVLPRCASSTLFI